MPLSFIFLGVILIFVLFVCTPKTKLIYGLCLLICLISYFLPSVITYNIMFNPLRLIAAIIIACLLSYRPRLSHILLMLGIIAISNIIFVILINQSLYTSMDFPLIYMVLLTITCMFLPKDVSFGTLFVAGNTSFFILACYHNYNGLLVEIMPEGLMLMIIIAFVLNNVLQHFVVARLNKNVYQKSINV